jgi:hypothetical protein
MGALAVGTLLFASSVIGFALGNLNGYKSYEKIELDGIKFWAEVEKEIRKNDKAIPFWEEVEKHGV